MLQAGYVFCSRCGHATQEAYYFSNTAQAWVQLVRTATGKFAVTRYEPPYMQGKTDNTRAGAIKRFRLSSGNSNEAHRLQNTIEVRCYNGKRWDEYTFVRSCPFCVGQKAGWDEAMKIIDHLGDLPTYVIAVAGAPSVGKSCWIHALSCPGNANRVNGQRESTNTYMGYLLSPAELVDEVIPPPPPTPLNGLGRTSMLYIKKRMVGGTAVPVAQVLVVDFAGELFSSRRKKEFAEEAAHIFEGGEGYSGVDAVVFMADPCPTEDGSSLADTYENAKSDYMSFMNKPLAFVMNKADMLIENPPMRHINGDPTLPAVPLLSKHTFTGQDATMYSKEYLQERVALQTYILKKENELVKTICNEMRGAGFLIKATTPIKQQINPLSDQTRDMLDFRESMNVMDPLVWILNELDIFPIDD